MKFNSSNLNVFFVVLFLTIIPKLFYCQSSSVKGVEYFLGKRVPSSDVRNLMNLRDLSFSDWNRTMNVFFTNKEISNQSCKNAIQYSEKLVSGTQITLMWQKCPNGDMVITLYDLLSETSESYLDDLLINLSNYYYKSDEVATYYKVKTENYSYTFMIKIDKLYEMLFIQRKSL